MVDPQPTVQVKMNALQAANRQLIAAEKRHKAAAKRMVEAGVALGDARRTVKRTLEALQPELPSLGLMDGAEVEVVRTALDTS